MPFYLIEVLNNITMPMNQVPFLFHMSDTFEGASVNVKLDSGAYNE